MNLAQSTLFASFALPLVGALVCLFSGRWSRYVALIVSLAGVAVGISIYQLFDPNLPQMQMKYVVSWIESFRIQFALGVDGLSLPLIVMTKGIVPIAILASWNEKRHTSAFMGCFLLLDAAMTGTFLATDIFLFYVLWEMMLIPMLLIIGIWGSTDRIYAAIKFFLYTFAGSVLMLIAIFWIFFAHFEQMGFYTAQIAAFYQLSFSGNAILFSLTTEHLVFIGFALAFLIKIPAFPFHTWLPDAHVQAPTGGSILLAAVLLKMGCYGLLRFCIPIAPAAFHDFIPIIAVLSLVGIVYGAWVAFHQSDLKKLVAYSSVSHLGFITLGICAGGAMALTGSMLQMVNHGLSTGALFLLVGIIYERRHTREMSQFGGIAKSMPWFAFFLVLVSASSMGVPGLNGFVGEFLILMGTFAVNPYWAGVAVLGVVFGAVYLLTMLRAVLFGPITQDANRSLLDLNAREWAAIVPLAVFIVFLGIYPKPFIEKFEPSLRHYWETTSSRIKASSSSAPNTVMKPATMSLSHWEPRP